MNLVASTHVSKLTWRLACATLALVACGDNELPTGLPLAEAGNLTIVAHEDDDLLFMQPDLFDVTARGDGLTNVYVTAGNGTHGADVAAKRYAGLMAAYTVATGATDWWCGWIDVLGHAVEHCRLASANVSLVFLAYPDGGKHGEIGDSLLHLWEGKIASATTVAPHIASYDRAGLVDTVATIIGATRPHTIRTLEVAATHGVDHSDHMLVGALAVLAVARGAPDVELVSYRGYDTENEPVTALEPVLAPAIAMVAHYDACTDGCAPCGQPCAAIGDVHSTWLHRRYAIGVTRAAAGVLRAGASCAGVAADGTLAMVDCAGAPTWQVARDGRTHVGDRCLAADASGQLAAVPCDADASRFYLDDDGHIWVGAPPRPQDGMDLAHLDCIVIDGGRPQARLCGADLAPSWELAPPIVMTARAALGLAATGRAVRLGDVTGDGKADLCAVDAGGLRCAPGDGAGGFGAALRVDSAARPLAVEPESLVLGDVDGDGRIDACGRDAEGILCATAASGFAAHRFTTVFAHAGPADARDRSLAVIEGKICGLVARGLVCAGAGSAAELRSPWPAQATAVWPADLAGDRRASWCAATPEGPACGRDGDRAVTSDGASWGYSSNGLVEGSQADGALPDVATAALADIDGDGRADLCTLRGDRVTCATNRGRGFGPRRTLIRFADGAAPSALWLGDLDGDGRADACVDIGASIACALTR